MKKHILVILLFSVSFLAFKDQAHALNSNRTHLVYFTGIGCPHCANVDPILLKNKVKESELMVIEYEIYQHRQNAPLLMSYDNKYKTGLGVPLVIAGNNKDKSTVGDSPILRNLDKIIRYNKANDIVLPNKTISFENLDISQMPGLPKIWYKNRLAVKDDVSSIENENIKEFLINGNIPQNSKISNKTKAALSGDIATFKNAVKINGWTLMYN